MAALLFVTTLLTSMLVSTVSAPAAPTSRVSVAHVRATVLRRINVIRSRFGLPAGHATTAYQAAVERAARTNNDPTVTVRAGMYEAYGLWGLNPTVDPFDPRATNALVDAWVYEDGWRGTRTQNFDCTSRTAVACNGHRNAVLSAPPVAGARLEIDVAVAETSWQGSPGTSVATLFIWMLPASRA